MNIEQHDKAVKRLLKEIGLWGTWRKARVEYINSLRKNSLFINNIPQCNYFSEVINSSFVWDEQEKPELWRKLYSYSERRLCLIPPSANEILQDENFLDSVKQLVKYEIK